MKKIVYIAHPISGDVEGNLKDLCRILRIININEHNLAPLPFFVDGLNFDFSSIIPVAPYYADCCALDDSDPIQRKLGIDNGIAIIETGIFDELWLTGDRISFGMNEEVKLFVKLGKPVINYIGKF